MAIYENKISWPEMQLEKRDCGFLEGGLVARKIFFSFHYDRDAWRASQVRNSNVIATDDQCGFIDAAEWESIEKEGNAAIERWIDEQLKGTSATVVLIGAETASRNWIQKEILKSWNRGNGIVGIRIHNIKDQDQKTDSIGRNPLDGFKLPDGKLLSSVCKTYDWVNDDGRENMDKWADEAAEIRAKYGIQDEIVTCESSNNQANKSYAASATPAAGFAPRSPWCLIDANRER